MVIGLLTRARVSITMPELDPTLEQLVAAGAYTPQLVAPLEQYVYEQVNSD